MEIQKFNFNHNELSVIVNEDGNPLFIAKDVCELLEIANSRDAVSRLDEDEKLTSVIPTSGQNRNITTITESGLYSLIMTSRKPEAKQFKKWVTSEVLPSIRKHGAYMTQPTLENVLNNPDLLIGLAQNLKAEREKVEQLNQQVVKQQPYVEFTKLVFDSDEKIDIGQAAKILELPYGRNTLFKILREEGVFFKNKNEPKQEFIAKGFFQIKQKWIERNNHDNFLIVKVLVTQKGLAYLSKILGVLEPTKNLVKIQ